MLNSYQIFKPFVSSNFLGRGLGLASAYGIIKNHQGHLDVENEFGKGSTFHVWLPKADLIAEN